MTMMTDWQKEQDERAKFKAWGRALNASRREVVKTLEKAGHRPNIWHKRDKGRTIMQVYLKNAASLPLLVSTVQKVNAKWSSRLVSPSGHQEMVCWDLSQNYIPGLGTLYTIMHCDPTRVEDNGQFAQYGRKAK